VYIDQNGYRSPRYPLEPLFRSVYIEKPDFNPTSLDLVTDRNNLRKLTQAISEERIEDFRIDVRVVGSTLFVYKVGETCS